MLRSADEIEPLLAAMRSPLPASFRISADPRWAAKLARDLHDEVAAANRHAAEGGSAEAVAPIEISSLPWIANGWQLSPPTNIRDPGVLRDDDGRHYIVFGACSGADQPDDTCYYLAELHDDMISYEPPRHLSVKGVLGHFGYGKADDKPFLHKRGDLYYLSWGCFYATASEVFGPYQYKGCIIEEDLVEEAFMVGNQTAERSQRWRSPASRGDDELRELLRPMEISSLGRRLPLPAELPQPSLAVQRFHPRAGGPPGLVRQGPRAGLRRRRRRRRRHADLAVTYLWKPKNPPLPPG